MPIFATLLEGLLSGLAAFLVRFVGVRLAAATAAVAALSVATVACLVEFNNTVVPFLSALFSTAYGQFLGLLFPPISGTCLAAIAASWACRTAWAWCTRNIKIFAGV